MVALCQLVRVALAVDRLAKGGLIVEGSSNLLKLVACVLRRQQRPACTDTVRLTALDKAVLNFWIHPTLDLSALSVPIVLVLVRSVSIGLFFCEGMRL